ncbi:heterokaryon incompatibility protein-domain-containing protein [Microdochium trichocladiopsis]|uniref:Heterokaryon incompatibility protein-domain-containing protein n=1 Tax=Microdochium trichocladiopsis TaxID=1682393 RepID=A0A9P8Y0T5_9PEZI|nr:heterokaryon incompatibility protein-domain-containing protein [Microdochium trichocladiopsis]KAH7026628.1 heterokaryon incompatibility protein-domain-containing protein [Microdochium trichocladiopsis]
MPVYQYQTLKPGYIRLIELLPGRADDALAGELIEVFLHEYESDSTSSSNGACRSFEALSYVWGSDAKPHNLISSSGGGALLPMTASLHGFLVRLRYSDRQRLVWADGICINQNDTREKEQQVGLMARIYRSASRVVADLGGEAPSPADSEQLGRFIDGCLRSLTGRGLRGYGSSKKHTGAQTSPTTVGNASVIFRSVL